MPSLMGVIMLLFTAFTQSCWFHSRKSARSGRACTMIQRTLDKRASPLDSMPAEDRAVSIAEVGSA